MMGLIISQFYISGIRTPSSKHVPLLSQNVSSINPVKLICAVDTHLSGLKLENLFVEAVSSKFKVLLRIYPSLSDVALLLDAPRIFDSTLMF